jgi:formamidopyrimidine-DNA glycosylase
MPEFPDVEGFRRVLSRNALGEKIAQVVVSDARILGKPVGLAPRWIRLFSRRFAERHRAQPIDSAASSGTSLGNRSWVPITK